MRITGFIFFICLTAFNVSHAQKEFWGSASFGGQYDDGFIFKTDSIGNNLEIVHHFQKSVDGENISALTLGSNNKLYGVASSGGLGSEGVFSSGTLFEYDLATDQFRVLEHFGPDNTKLPLGMTTPRAEGVPNLFEVSPGVFYVLFYQGRYVYSYNINTATFTKPFNIPTYQGGATNGTLQNILNQSFYKAADGFLYVSTQTNSMCPIPNPNAGSIMRVNPANNTISTLHRASCQIEYGFMYNGFFAEVNGKLYSTTSYGGINNKGVIYSYTPASNTFVKLHDFSNSTSSFEPTSLVLAKNGKLYGTAHGGGIPEPNLGLASGGGVLFEFDLITNTFIKKHDFTIAGQSIYDMGVFPSALITSTNGKLYGTTQYGLFEYDPAANDLRVAGRFEGVGFAPSFLQVCRKPAYQALATSNYTVCEGTSFTVDLSSANTESVVWKHDGVVDASQTTTALDFSSFTPDDAGTWVCTLANECGETIAQTITLTNGKPAAPAIIAEGPTTFCEGGTVTLSAPDDFIAYVWSNGSTTQNITVSAAGNYSVKVNDGCESSPSESVTVTVNSLPPAPTGITAAGKVLTATGGSDSYVWTVNNVLLEQTSSQIEAVESGTYRAYSLSANGCQSPDYASISFTITGTEPVSSDDIVVYPNPARGLLRVKGDPTFRGQINVLMFNAAGNMVFSQSLELREEPGTLYLNNLSSGLYDLMIRKGNKIIVKKIVVVH